MFTVKNITVNYQDAPRNVEIGRPLRFGWQIDAPAGLFRQASYRIGIASTKDLLVKNQFDVLDTGVVESAESDNIDLSGKINLKDCTEYFAAVTVNCTCGKTGTGYTQFETALSDANFTSRWISQKKFIHSWAQYLRKEFILNTEKKVVRARAYFAGLGVGELYLNGKRVEDRVFDLPISNYGQEILYDCFDVTDFLSPDGKNCCAILLGDGWYDQRRAWYTCCHFGDPRARLEIHVFYADGTVDKILTDESFSASFSPITDNNVYCGETYDARLEQEGFSEFGFDQEGWTRACVKDAPGGIMRPTQIPPIRKVREVKPVSVRTRHENSNENCFIYDFGENFTGFVRLKPMNSAPGCQIVIRYAEDIDRHGDAGLWYASSGPMHIGGIQQDIYICKGFGRDREWSPRFTYHGFRYAEVTGIQGGITPPEDMISAYAVNTDLTTAGAFITDNALINTFQETCRRTFLSNYHGVPEDCPVREKCGWLGDAQIVSDMGIYNFNMRNAYEKYLSDIRTTKKQFGTWMQIAPGNRLCGEASPLWGSCQVILPWNLYLYYNDRAILTECYDDMAAWIRHELARSEDYIIREGLGDWAPPRPEATKEDPSKERYRMPVEQSSTAEFFHVTSLMIKIAEILGKSEDRKFFGELADGIREAFNRHYLKTREDGSHTYGYEGTDGVALEFGLVPLGMEKEIADDFFAICDSLDGRMFTGIFCNKALAPALTEMGFGDRVYDYFFGDHYRNFKFMLDQGATSIWETFTEPWLSPDVASLNHPMHTGFTYYFYRNLLGIRPDEKKPGFRHFIVKPTPIRALGEVSGYYDSNHGRISVSWKNGERFSMTLTVPNGTTADVILPDGRIIVNVPSGTHTF